MFSLNFLLYLHGTLQQDTDRLHIAKKQNSNFRLDGHRKALAITVSGLRNIPSKRVVIFTN